MLIKYDYKKYTITCDTLKAINIHVVVVFISTVDINLISITEKERDGELQKAQQQEKADPPSQKHGNIP